MIIPSKRVLLPLLATGPLVYFLGGYLGGIGLFPGFVSLLVSLAGVLLVPAVVSAAFFWTLKAPWAARVFVYLFTLALQGALFFLVPSAAASQMIGTAHRLRLQYSPDQLRQCATDLRQKFRDGTLSIKQDDESFRFWLAGSASRVDPSALPTDLRSRFKAVFIDDHKVIFAIEEDIGIICGSGKSSKGTRIYTIAEGVDAYRYHRL